jgi:LAO/AO transport system kinase
VSERGASKEQALSELIRGLVEGDRRSLARTLSILEHGGSSADLAFRLIASSRRDGQASSSTLGVTGSPGSGKSTLVDALVAHARLHDVRVAVVAVDPSSPLTGGAILGDRVRLRQSNSSDDGFYMRSIAARGALGGLATVVPGAVRAISAAGWPTIIIETVGVGQSEVAVAAQADTTVVVVNPDAGDEVQANKAGLLEMADIFVVNKADRVGTDKTVHDLRAMLHLSPLREWAVPVLRTTATKDQGIDEVWDAAARHREHLRSSGEGRERRIKCLRAEIEERVAVRLRSKIHDYESSFEGRMLFAEVESGELDPVSAAERLLEGLGS